MGIKFKFRESDINKPGMEKYPDSGRSPFNFGPAIVHYPITYKPFDLPKLGEKK